MDDEFKELQTLLRLKQYERPPQGFESYSERFLKEFHRRQRWETARSSGWALWREKMSDWMNTFTVPRYAYVTTLAVFGAIALGVNGWHPADAPVALASANPALPHAASIAASVAPQTALALNSKLDLSDLEVQSKMDPGSQISNTQIQPRYILDARPASYNAGFSF